MSLTPQYSQINLPPRYNDIMKNYSTDKGNYLFDIGLSDDVLS